MEAAYCSRFASNWMLPNSGVGFFMLPNSGVGFFISGHRRDIAKPSQGPAPWREAEPVIRSPTPAVERMRQYRRRRRWKRLIVRVSRRIGCYRIQVWAFSCYRIQVWAEFRCGLFHFRASPPSTMEAAYCSRFASNWMLPNSGVGFFMLPNSGVGFFISGHRFSVLIENECRERRTVTRLPLMTSMTLSTLLPPLCLSIRREGGSSAAGGIAPLETNDATSIARVMGSYWRAGNDGGIRRDIAKQPQQPADNECLERCTVTRLPLMTSMTLSTLLPPLCLSIRREGGSSAAGGIAPLETNDATSIARVMGSYWRAGNDGGIRRDIAKPSQGPAPWREAEPVIRSPTPAVERMRQYRHRRRWKRLIVRVSRRIGCYRIQVWAFLFLY